MILRKGIARILEKTVTSYVLLVIILSLMLAPIIFTLSTSFKTREETFSWPPTYFPKKPTLEAYREVLFRSPILRYLLNSLIIAFGTTIIVMIGGLFTAYGLSQYKFKGAKT
ncbi:MAG: carbohydrate ABC transporter permease, partial [Spirochaetota bacterium]